MGKDHPLANHVERANFARLLRAVFDHRRKILRVALGYVVDEPAREHIAQGIDTTRRPESFSVSEWVQMFNVLRSADQDSG